MLSIGVLEYSFGHPVTEKYECGTCSMISFIFMYVIIYISMLFKGVLEYQFGHPVRDEYIWYL